MQLSELRPGASFRVGKVLVGGEIGKRLADMGFTEGAEGELVRSAFLRGPVQIRIRGYDLLVRRSEARLIEIEARGEASGEAAGKMAAAGTGVGGADGGGFERRRGGTGYRPNRGRGFGIRAFFAPQDCCGGQGGRRGPGGPNGHRSGSGQAERDGAQGRPE